MADEQVEQFDHCREDIRHIPGASVSEEQIGKLTVSQLKFLLKCGRINQNGNKKELLEGKLVHFSYPVILRSLAVYFSRLQLPVLP